MDRAQPGGADNVGGRAGRGSMAAGRDEGFRAAGACTGSIEAIDVDQALEVVVLLRLVRIANVRPALMEGEVRHAGAVLALEPWRDDLHPQCKQVRPS